MAKQRTLHVRLLRENRAIESAFEENFKPGNPRAPNRRPWRGIEGAVLFFGQLYANPPSWLKFIATGTAEPLVDMMTGGAGAVIFVPVKGRIVAICFGHIHMALDDDAFERQFGLRTTLNSVPRTKLRTLDLATPDAVTFQKRVQASKDSSLEEFGVDRLRDLARTAGGTATNRKFASFLAGKDSLSITCEVDAETLLKKSTEILDAYNAKTYQTEFAWVDNLRIVAEQDVIDQLDQHLLAALQDLREGRPSDLHMAPPEIVDYTEGSELHYNGFGSHGTNFESLSIYDYANELNRTEFAGTIADIKKSHRISAMKPGGEKFTERWKVYDCFTFEATLGAEPDAKHFVLFAGNWYAVEKSFKAGVEAFFNNIPRVHIVGPTQCKNEQELIEHLHANAANLVKLDQEKINPAGVKRANLEPCDFFSDQKHFIHLKDGHSSGPISHLWSQGVVSAEAFVSDKKFRTALRAKVKAKKPGFENHLPRAEEKVIRDEYTVVYGIMRKPYADGTLDLPFFSKVSLQAAAERIEIFGLPIALELIEKPAADTEEQE